MTGYLPFRGSFMLDTVVLAMVAVVVLLAVSLSLAGRGRVRAHRNLQLGLAIVLGIAVTLFEIDLRFVTRDWQKLAEPSPYFAPGWVHRWLAIHLVFAVPTPIWWAVVIVRALRGFGSQLTPGAHSSWHRVAGRIAMVLMLGTAITGWIFYYVAFVA